MDAQKTGKIGAGTARMVADDMFRAECGVAQLIGETDKMVVRWRPAAATTRLRAMSGVSDGKLAQSVVVENRAGGRIAGGNSGRSGPMVTPW